MVLGQLARAVSYRDKNTFMRLYQVFVLPHLSYAVQAWSPYNKADKEVLEKVQQRAVMMVSNLRGTYEERLVVLNMRTLEDRRIRGDLIETYKILTGKSDVNLESWFTVTKVNEDTVNTRYKTGYLHLTQPPQPKTDLRRNFFSHRVVNQWNQLPDSVKMVETINGFKNSYDSFTGYKKL